MGFNIETGQFTITRKAAADLRTKQYHFVKEDVNGDVVSCSVVGEGALGVLQNDPNTGEAAVVCISGPTQVVAGAALASNGIGVKTNAAGRAILATRLVQATGAGARALGVPITDAAADGEVMTILCIPLGAVIPTSDA